MPSEGKCRKCGKTLPELQMTICAECMGPIRGVHTEAKMPSEERSCESCDKTDHCSEDHKSRNYMDCAHYRQKQPTEGQRVCPKCGGEMERDIEARSELWLCMDCLSWVENGVFRSGHEEKVK